MPVTVSQWVSRATERLKAAGISSARLDAEILLAHTIHRPRTFLHAHNDDVVEAHRLEIAEARLELRIARTPIAYIVGHKEFYGRQFTVTTATLIPRPESEAFIELLDEIIPKNQPLLPTDSIRLVDVGTGSGCLGITAKLEHQELHVTLTDVSKHALNVADKNAKRLGAEVQLERGDLLRGKTRGYDIILANLPYVDRQWEVSPETNAEPETALYANKNGLALINQLIVQANNLLSIGGYLLLESDPRQHQSVTAECNTHGFKIIETRGFVQLFIRVD